MNWTHADKLAWCTGLSCPECKAKLDYSEHAYFEYDVIAMRCQPCRLYTILGAPEWIKFPDRDGGLDAFNEASEQLRAMGKAVHDAGGWIGEEPKQETWRDRPSLL